MHAHDIVAVGIPSCVCDVLQAERMLPYLVEVLFVHAIMQVLVLSPVITARM